MNEEGEWVYQPDPNEPTDPNEPIEPEHVTDDSACWCQPQAERQPDGTYVIVHRRAVQ